MSTLDELNADLQRVNDSALTAQILIEHGWRKKPSEQELAETLDRIFYEHEGGYLGEENVEFYQARAILALMDRGQ